MSKTIKQLPFDLMNINTWVLFIISLVLLTLYPIIKDPFIQITESMIMFAFNMAFIWKIIFLTIDQKLEDIIIDYWIEKIMSDKVKEVKISLKD